MVNSRTGTQRYAFIFFPSVSENLPEKNEAYIWKGIKNGTFSCNTESYHKSFILDAYVHKSKVIAITIIIITEPSTTAIVAIMLSVLSTQ